MFGSKKIEELEARVRELTESLSKQQAENGNEDFFHDQTLLFCILLRNTVHRPCRSCR